jgi:hypothetical protein
MFWVFGYLIVIWFFVVEDLVQQWQHACVPQKIHRSCCLQQTKLQSRRIRCRRWLRFLPRGTSLRPPRDRGQQHMVGPCLGRPLEMAETMWRAGRRQDLTQQAKAMQVLTPR